MRDDEKEAGGIDHRAPERLINWLARPGFDVRLLVRREDGEPLSDDDVARLDASISAYEIKDVEDTGPAFEPPKDGES